MAKKPNIIFILQDHQSFYGHGEYEGGVKPKRPEFEKFAKAGVEFTNARCVTPMCGPARRSLLTGLYPHNHKQVHNENVAPYEQELVLDVLKDEGYNNYYYGKWHAGLGAANDHGAEGFSYTGYGNPYTTQEYNEYLEKRNLPPAQHYIETSFEIDSYNEAGFFPKLKECVNYKCESNWCGEHASGITITDKDTHESFFLANLACDRLEEIAKEDNDNPFSLSVHFWGPHQPFFPTKEFADLYNPEEIGEYPSFKDNLKEQPDVFKMEVSRPLTSDGKWIDTPNSFTWKEFQMLMARCYGHISMIDAAGGQIINKVKELGLDENTIIIWTTDHGDALATHGGHFDKDSHMMEEVMRVPLAINYKDHIPKNVKNNNLVFTCDIPITALDAAEIKFTHKVDGKSLLPLLTDSSINLRNQLMCESYGHGYGTTIISRMIVNKEYKYIATEDDLEQLYNLEKDPFELDNLAYKINYFNIKELMKKVLKEEQLKANDPIALESLLNKAIIEEQKVLQNLK